MSGYLDTRTLDDELDELQSRADDEKTHKEDEPPHPGYDATDEEQQEWETAWDLWEALEPSDPLDNDERCRLAALTSLRDEFDHRDWRDGVTLIPENDFEDYARQMAEDCGYCNSDNPLVRYVDWDKWAHDVQMDYTSVEFDGETYYYRS